MSEFIEAGTISELKEGAMKAVKVADREIMLVKVHDEIYAASNICPHMKARLSKGALKGTIVTCPRHASQFDLKDGHVVRWTNWSGLKLALSKLFLAPHPLDVYAVKTEGDTILIKL